MATGENLTDEHRILIDYLDMRSDLTSLDQKLAGSNGLRTAAQFIKDELSKKVSKYSSSLALTDGSEARELGRTHKSVHNELYDEARRINDEMAGVFDYMNDPAHGANENDWEHFAQVVLDRAEQLKDLFGTVEGEALRWQGGRMHLSKLEKKCQEQFKRPLERMGVQELKELGIRFSVIRQQMHYKLEALEEMSQMLEGLRQIYIRSCENAGVRPVSLEYDLAIFNYLKNNATPDEGVVGFYDAMPKQQLTPAAPAAPAPAGAPPAAPPAPAAGLGPTPP